MPTQDEDTRRQRVELAERFRPKPGRGYTAGHARGLIVIGALMLALCAAGAVALFAAPPSAAGGALVGIIALTVVGAFLVTTGRGRLRRLRGFGRDAPLSAPYAFDITASALEFPATPDQDAQVWPLAASRARIGTLLGMRALIIETPDARTRKYLDRVLDLGADDALRRIAEAQQAAGTDAPDDR